MLNCFLEEDDRIPKYSECAQCGELYNDDLGVEAAEDFDEIFCSEECRDEFEEDNHE